MCMVDAWSVLNIYLQIEDAVALSMAQKRRPNLVRGLLNSCLFYDVLFIDEKILLYHINIIIVFILSLFCFCHSNTRHIPQTLCFTSINRVVFSTLVLTKSWKFLTKYSSLAVCALSLSNIECERASGSQLPF